MKRIAVGAAGLATMAVFAACGGSTDASPTVAFSEQPAADVAAAAESAMTGLTSFRMVGTVTADGMQNDLDFRVDTDGGCVGTIGREGSTVEVLGVDGEVWFRPDEAFWRLTKGAAADQFIAAVGDRWLLVSAEDGAALVSYCDASTMLLNFGQLGEGGTATTGSDTVDGQDVVALNGPAAGGVGRTTWYVLTGEPHYVVKVADIGTGRAGSLTFSDFDTPVPAEAPAPGEQIEPDDLGRRGAGSESQQPLV